MGAELDKEKVLARLARRQWGLVSRQQLETLGFSSDYFLRRVKAGAWRRVFRGVFSTNSGGMALRHREVAALLAVGPDAVLSHHSAAHWLKIATPLTEPIQVTVPRPKVEMKLPGVEIWCTRSLPNDEKLNAGPIRLTKRGRTLLDLAGVLEPMALRAAVDSCLRDDRSHFDELWGVLEASGVGKAGASRLRGLLEDYLAGQKVPDSVLESYAMELGLATGRRPLVRHVVFDGPRRIAEVDLAWPELRVAAQLDGYWPHTTKKQFEVDHVQDRALKDLGWDVPRYTHDEVTKTRDVVLRSLLRFVTRRREALDALEAGPPVDAP